MKIKSKELNVDFIGGQNSPLTNEEEKAISAFIIASKDKRNIKKAKKKLTIKQKQYA